MASTLHSFIRGCHLFKNIKHHNASSSAFVEMMKSGQYCDVVITADNSRFNCHKMILSATCPYFRVMFSSPFEENESNTVEIKDIKSDIMENLIMYLYKGEVEITTTNAQDMIFAADMFQLDALKEACSCFLQSQLRTYNCLGIWNVARQLQVVDLEEHAWNVARSSFTRVAEQEEFLDLSSVDVCLLLTDTKLKLVSEESLCKSAIRWLLHKPERKIYLDLVMKTVHITELNPAYIRTFLMTHSLFRNSAYWSVLFQKVLDYLTMNMPCPSDLPALPIRVNTDSITGVLLLGGKVNRPMVRTHECTFVTIDSAVGIHDRTQSLVTQEIITHLPTTHKYTAACNQGNTVYVSGMGSDLQGLYKYDNAQHWTLCEKMRFSRNGHTLLSGFTDSLFAVGGSEVASDVSHNIATIEEYSIPENSWKTAGVLSQPVCYAGAMFYAGKIFVMGGFLISKAACSKIQMFDTQTGVCVKLETRLPRPMAYCKGVVVEEKLLLVDKEMTLVFKASELLGKNNMLSAENHFDTSDHLAEDAHNSEADQNDNGNKKDTEENEGNSSIDNDESVPILKIEDTANSVENLSEFIIGEEQQLEQNPHTSSRSSQTLAASGSADCKFIIKPGCGVELAAAECLGNKLMVFGGRRDERDHHSNRVLTKSIKAANIEDFLAVGAQPTWETVGRLAHPMIVFMTAKIRIKK